MARKQLLVDVSVIARVDAGTGIQRVVKEILKQLVKHPPAHFDVKPVRASRWHNYKYVAKDIHSQADRYSISIFDPTVLPSDGDVFLGLDFSAHILPYRRRQLEHWNKTGVKIFFIVYDLLPAQHPEWFSKKGSDAYRRWLHTIKSYADGLVCISRSVAHDLSNWLDAHDPRASKRIDISWFHLGSDLTSSAPSDGTPPKYDSLIQSIGQRLTIMMVGTVEPRKGYAQALSAFENIWQQGIQVNLVIVGKTAWKVKALASRLRNHPENGKRLFWLEFATDEMLCALYQASTGLLVASEGEGFCLPVVEAARYGKPILTRDLPVLREIARDGATYFTAKSSRELAPALRSWLTLLGRGDAPSSRTVIRQSWEKSTEQLIQNVVSASKRMP